MHPRTESLQPATVRFPALARPLCAAGPSVGPAARFDPDEGTATVWLPARVAPHLASATPIRLTPKL